MTTTLFAKRTKVYVVQGHTKQYNLIQHKEERTGLAALLEQEKNSREGATWGQADRRVNVWEVYQIETRFSRR